MKCPLCSAELAWLDELHYCPFQDVREPTTPDSFGGTDVDSHYMSFKVQTPQEIAKKYIVHDLKTWPKYFEKIYEDIKTFEVRKNDRDFKVGDVLRLREWDPKSEKYSGREIFTKILYLLTDTEAFGSLMPGHVIISFQKMR